MNNRIQRPPVIAYKLRDVPELGYYTTDKPYPRGELCYKTDSQIKGYYKQPEATAKLFDEEGLQPDRRYRRRTGARLRGHHRPA